MVWNYFALDVYWLRNKNDAITNSKFYAAIANDGQRMKPLFVKSIMANGIIQKNFNPEVLNPSICSMTTIKKVKQMLEGVVEDGTAKNIKSKQYKIAGKTGTAQLIIDGVYDNQRHLASFVGYFPADNPKYAAIVMINDPKKTVVMVVMLQHLFLEPFLIM